MFWNDKQTLLVGVNLVIQECLAELTNHKRDQLIAIPNAFVVEVPACDNALQLLVCWWKKASPLYHTTDNAVYRPHI